ncbi:helix-turn-helix domain-containing protein [Cytobacillus oceanisediminis]|uniref:helix-turn-helix domain-containing protein n=1 Tax=Cytobacillus oceanisediminis TaxID=665099 RepID=UPI001FB54CDA|nr:helix-turn-helix transcriptional regulator [Cytobacillus oceanisediminis]UOE54945.1 helix-turn-helix transcriptional regulator [Cytobacillus oceanisediminis]
MRKKMKDQRIKLGLSQQEVADKSGLSRANYSHIERGRSEPNLSQMVSIAKVLKVDPNANFFVNNCDKTEHNKNLA